MATLNYDKDQKFLWATLDDGSTIPIYTLLNLEKTQLRVTDAGLLQVYNNQSKEYENIEGPSLKGPIGNTIQIELGTIATSENADASLIKSDDGLTAILNLSLPKGDPGPQGPKGDQGESGDKGEKGDRGEEGAPGKVLYTWIKYADNENGSGLSDSPVSSSGSKAYIGFAYNKEDPTESNNASDYKWTLIKGADGTDGIPGEKGADGVSYYTWIKYSDNLPTSNADLYEEPKDTTQYIGIATNKTDQSESSDYTQYNWSKFKGDQGVAGEKGDKGDKGDKGEDLTYITAFPVEPEYGDRVIWNGPPIVSDLVPSGITETGETYEYQNSDSVPDSIMKTSYVLQLGTDSTNMSEYTSFDIKYTKPVYDLISRKSKLISQEGMICITLDMSYSSLRKNLPSVYLLWRHVESLERTTAEEQQLKNFINSLDFEANPTISLYCSCYITSTNLSDDTGYWIPITDLNRAKYSYSLS